MPRRRSFNSRSREGSDGIKKPLCGAGVWVSIRAPARGATHNPAGRAMRRQCFNSRSREGSDGERATTPAMTRGFNSRSREGSDRRVWAVALMVALVSIRAPARGATQSGRACHAAAMFQFALPRGERPLPPVWGRLFVEVSIRAPARGATDNIADAARVLAVSIRAPARGATRDGRRGAGRYAVSIRAPARGATLVL